MTAPLFYDLELNSTDRMLQENVKDLNLSTEATRKFYG